MVRMWVGWVVYGWYVGGWVSVYGWYVVGMWLLLEGAGVLCSDIIILLI